MRKPNYLKKISFNPAVFFLAVELTMDNGAHCARSYELLRNIKLANNNSIMIRNFAYKTIHCKESNEVFIGRLGF